MELAVPKISDFLGYFGYLEFRMVNEFHSPSHAYLSGISDYGRVVEFCRLLDNTFCLWLSHEINLGLNVLH